MLQEHNHSRVVEKGSKKNYQIWDGVTQIDMKLMLSKFIIFVIIIIAMFMFQGVLNVYM